MLNQLQEHERLVVTAAAGGAEGVGGLPDMHERLVEFLAAVPVPLTEADRERAELMRALGVR